jgi:TPP-dependent pyruvate/acetoin dehydrogenase alpha subunit
VPQRKLTKEFLINFESDVARAFNEGQIKAPVHLSSGGEEALIEIFSSVKEDDFVFTTWRSHYHALLKGVEPSVLMKEILDGRSIALNFPSKKLYSSAIAGSHIPVAVGLAYSIKLKKSDEKVWCFLGDMVSESGIAEVSFKFAERFKLPITFVIEDNNRSVCSDTRKVWNSVALNYQETKYSNVIFYSYQSVYPHAGAGVRVQF